MKGFVVHSEYWFGDLSFVPYDGSIQWTGSAAWSAAHVFTEDGAQAVVAALPVEWKARVCPDYGNRAPQPIPSNARIVMKRRAA